MAHVEKGITDLKKPIELGQSKYVEEARSPFLKPQQIMM
jgi:hypothetical protein